MGAQVAQKDAQELPRRRSGRSGRCKCTELLYNRHDEQTELLIAVFGQQQHTQRCDKAPRAGHQHGRARVLMDGYTIEHRDWSNFDEEVGILYCNNAFKPPLGDTTSDSCVLYMCA
uniref:Uncharacterized protein n=1 Tax=Hyaloperonospora arabidopsidis (strain Emoy2) TaxID=559515 RepID=M4BWW9_HYAAE